MFRMSRLLPWFGLPVALGVFAFTLLSLAGVRLPASEAPQRPNPPRQPAVVQAAASSAPAPVPHPRPNASAASPLVVRRVLDTGGPIATGAWFWQEEGAPAGPLVITVDLAAETISVFRGGYEIGTAAIIFGADEKPTPLGVFPILQKDAHHVSNLYDAPMPYTLRLTNDGVAIHASAIDARFATHGCVGVPLAFAKRLFAVAHIGDRVIVTRGKALEVGQPIVRS